MSSYIKLEYPGSHVALITISDPPHLNAFSPELLKELSAAIDHVNQAPDIHAAVITGTGKAFVAGADIRCMQSFQPAQAMQYSADTTAIYDKIENSGKIFLAAVNGYAFGAGFELTLACDLRYASEYGKFSLPETGLGIIPGGHGTQKLPSIIGSAKAKELIFLGSSVKAPEALSLGILNGVFKAEELVPETVRIAETIASGAHTAISYAKQAVNMSEVLDQKSGYDYEEKLFGLCFATDEQKEGMTAFIEKRKPSYS